MCPHSRDAMRPRRCCIFRPKEGVGNAGCPLHPRPRVHLVVVERTRVTTSTPESPGIPARNGFNGFLRALVRARQPDFLTPYLKAILGTIGLHDLTFFSMEGSALGPDAVAEARTKTDPIDKTATACDFRRRPSGCLSVACLEMPKRRRVRLFRNGHAGRNHQFLPARAASYRRQRGISLRPPSRYRHRRDTSAVARSAAE